MRISLVALLVIALGSPNLARAQAKRDAPPMSDELRQHWERGLAEHTAKRYEAASTAFEVCYQLDPRREFLFAWAQAARLSGDCPAAIALYRRYLEVAISETQIEAAESQITACEAVVAAATHERAPVDEPRTATPIAAPAVQPAVGPGARSPWYTDVWGDLLVGTGAAALVTGTVMFVSSGQTATSDASSYEVYARRFADAERRRTTSVIALGAGAALVTAGILHMILRTDERSTRVDVGIGSAQVGIHVRRSF